MRMRPQRRTCSLPQRKNPGPVQPLAQSKTPVLRTAMVVLFATAALCGRADLRDTLSRTRIAGEWKNASLDQVVADLARIARINAAYEPPEEAKRLTLRVEGTALEAVEQACAAFSYSWRPSTTGDLLLYRRFGDGDSAIPQFCRAEIQQSADYCLQTLSAYGFSPRRSVSEGIRALWAALSDRQRAALASGQYLPVADLSLNQKRLVSASIYSTIAFNAYLTLKHLRDEAANLNGGFIELIADSATNPFTGEKVDQSTPFLRLKTGSGKPHGTSIYQYPPFIKKTRVPPGCAPLNDADTPLAGSPGGAPDVATLCLSLPDLARTLAEGRLTVNVAPAIAGRKAAAIRTQGDSLNMLAAVCELGGLSMDRLEDGAALISRHPPKPPRSLTDVVVAIRQSFPADVGRFIGLDTANPTGSLATAPPDQQDRVMDLADKVAARVRARLRERHERLFQWLKPRLTRSGRILVTDLTESERQQILDVLCLQALNSLSFYNLVGGVPTYAHDIQKDILHFEGSHLEIMIPSPQGSPAYMSGYSASVLPPTPIRQ